MSDWTGQRPLPETPADTAPDLPTPWTPGGSRWIQLEPAFEEPFHLRVRAFGIFEYGDRGIGM
jgi:hypothetical protein